MRHVPVTEVGTPPVDPRRVGVAVAFLDRMQRNSATAAQASRAETPGDMIFRWAEEGGVPAEREKLRDLATMLRGSRLLFDEDGKLAGAAIADALDEQADLCHDWPAANKLRLLAARVRDMLGGLGLL